MTRLLSFSGSSRDDSFNQRLIKIAATAANEAEIDVTQIQLSDYDLPLYSHAAETNDFPPAARALKAQMIAHDGFLIATPEYNGSIPPLLKNAIDWASRPTDGESPVALSAYRGKTAGIMSASPSPFGGLRALAHLRQILSTIQMIVIPEQVAIPAAHTAFEGEALKDPLQRQLLAGLVTRTGRVAGALKN